MKILNRNKSNSPLAEGWQTQSDGVLNRKLKRTEKMEHQSDGVFEKYKKLPYNPKLKDRAKELRKAGNLSEALFWNQVKNKKFLSLDFHRQKIIGNYIVDFYCPILALVVEIDGSSHNDKVEYDKIRENYLISLGLYILHYDDMEIKKNLNSVVENLKEHCEDLIRNTPSSQKRIHPSARGEYNTPSSQKRIHPSVKRGI
ncbi:MAG: DUF559 domain-containing protein [Candidatus Cloacimonadales bacterium]|nr:DUF559 domain-containing protein [Candidatus Cloacimonadales bacterium]